MRGWVIQTTTKSICKHCHNYLDLVSCNDDPTESMFYICWTCKKVLIVGEGEVPRSGNLNDLPSPV